MAGQVRASIAAYISFVLVERPCSKFRLSKKHFLFFFNAPRATNHIRRLYKIRTNDHEVDISSTPNTTLAVPKMRAGPNDSSRKSQPSTAVSTKASPINGLVNVKSTLAN